MIEDPNIQAETERVGKRAPDMRLLAIPGSIRALRLEARYVLSSILDVSGTVAGVGQRRHPWVAQNPHGKPAPGIFANSMNRAKPFGGWTALALSPFLLLWALLKPRS